MPREDNYILPAALGTLTPAEWDAKGKAAVLAWQPMAERYRRADTYTRGRKHQPVLLAQVHPDRWPFLAAYLVEHPNKSGYDGWPPTITRSHAARLRQMQTIKADCAL